MISALARMYAVSLDPGLLKAALDALVYANTHLFKDGGYYHEATQKNAFFLADQIGMLKGLLALHEITGDVTYLDQASKLASFVMTRLKEPTGLFLSRTQVSKAVGVFAEKRLPFDENVAVARGFLKLYAFVGEGRFREDAERILKALGNRPTLANQGRWLGDFLLAWDELQTEASHLTVVGSRKDQRTQALHRATLGLWMPHGVVIFHDPKDGVPRNPDLGFPILNEPAVFLCGKGSCSRPFKDPQTLAEDIRQTVRKK